MKNRSRYAAAALCAWALSTGAHAQQEPGITDKTITDPDTLIAALPDLRRQGFARVDEENIRGIVSVGAPIRNAHGKIVAALSVAFTKGTTSLEEDMVTKLVLDTAHRVSRAIGCPETLMSNWDL